MLTRALGPQFAPAWHRPFLRYADAVDGAEGGNGDNEPKFPANTPVKDMTPEQQAAYWQHQSRKHEDRNKAFGEWTPDKIAALQTERDTLRTQGQSDADKALDAAREEGRNEVRGELAKVNATHALEKALTGRSPDASALLGLDVTRFIVNGQVDDAAVKAWVDDHSTEQSGQQQKRIDTGQGDRGTSGDGTKSVSAGRDLYAERHKKNNS